MVSVKKKHGKLLLKKEKLAIAVAMAIGTSGGMPMYAYAGDGDICVDGGAGTCATSTVAITVIANNTSSISTNSTSITNNTSSIGVNSTSITSNATRIGLLDTSTATGTLNVQTANIGSGGIDVQVGGLNVDASGGGAVSLNTNVGGGTTSSLDLAGDGSSASLLVNNGTATHGLRVGTTSTSLSGGTASTVLLLDDSGVTIGVDDGAGNPTGGDVQIHGVAPGTAQNDAVNVSQLGTVSSALDTLSSTHASDIRRLEGGIASVTALAMIPEPQSNNYYSFGIGLANYEGESAAAIGFNARLTEALSIKIGAGISARSNTFGAGMGYSW